MGTKLCLFLGVIYLTFERVGEKIIPQLCLVVYGCLSVVKAQGRGHQQGKSLGKMIAKCQLYFHNVIA